MHFVGFQMLLDSESPHFSLWETVAGVRSVVMFEEPGGGLRVRWGRVNSVALPKGSGICTVSP